MDIRAQAGRVMKTMTTYPREMAVAIVDGPAIRKATLKRQGVDGTNVTAIQAMTTITDAALRDHRPAGHDMRMTMTMGVRHADVGVAAGSVIPKDTPRPRIVDGTSVPVAMADRTLTTTSTIAVHRGPPGRAMMTTAAPRGLVVIAVGMATLRVIPRRRVKVGVIAISGCRS